MSSGQVGGGGGGGVEHFRHEYEMTMYHLDEHCETSRSLTSTAKLSSRPI